MNNFSGIVKTATTILKQNSPLILTAIGVSGSISTAYLAGKASFEAANVLRDAPEDLSTKEKIDIVWENYIPAAISGVITVGCIIAASRVSAKRTAAAYSLVSLSEKAFYEYKEKVTEKLGEKKELAIRNEIAQDKVTNNAPGHILVTGTGDVLCCELFTGRYFYSDMEKLRKTQNDINSKLVTDLFVPLSEFYYLIGLPYTTHSSSIGWESTRLLSLEFSTVFSEDNKPCLAFDYNYTKAI